MLPGGAVNTMILQSDPENISFCSRLETEMEARHVGEETYHL